MSPCFLLMCRMCRLICHSIPELWLLVAGEAMSYSARIKDLFKRYGKIGVAVHLGVYGATFAGTQEGPSALWLLSSCAAMA